MLYQLPVFIKISSVFVINEWKRDERNYIKWRAKGQMENSQLEEQVLFQGS
jgi:hypothetical protein